MSQGNEASRHYSVRNTLGILVLDVAAKVLVAGAGLLIIRYMAPNLFADLTLAGSVRNFLSGVFAASFNRIYIVGYRRFRLATSASSLLAAQFLLLAAAGAAFLPLVLTLGWLYPFVLGWVFSQAFFDFARTQHQQQFAFRTFALFEIAKSALFVLGVLALAGLRGDRMGAAEVMLLHAVSMVGAVFLFSPAEAVALLRGPKREIWSHLKAMVGTEYKYLFIYTILLSTLAQIDVFMLRARADDQALAAYGSAFQYYALAVLLVSAVQAILLPAVQQAATVADIRALFQKHRKLLLLTAPLFFVGAWIAGWVLPLVDRGKYPEAVLALRILAASAFVSLAFSPHSTIVMRFEDFRFQAGVALAALLGALGLQLLLVPRFGAAGAALGVLVSYALLNGANYARAAWLLARRPLSDLTREGPVT